MCQYMFQTARVSLYLTRLERQYFLVNLLRNPSCCQINQYSQVKYRNLYQFNLLDRLLILELRSMHLTELREHPILSLGHLCLFAIGQFTHLHYQYLWSIP